MWFADDATAGGSLKNFKAWWDKISELGPGFGYHPNAVKTWLVTKESHLERATELFNGTGISITAEGRRHLGAAIGTQNFTESYVKQKVTEWVTMVERLADIATSQPHAAYAAFTHGLAGKWGFLVRTIPDIVDLLQPLEDAIRLKFLPALTGQNAFNDLERDVIALPVCLGGLGIANPCKHSSSQHSMSEEISAPLATLIIQQTQIYPPETKTKQIKAKNNSRTIRRQMEQTAANELHEKLNGNMQMAMKLSVEKGAPSWLSALPIVEHGFALHKGAFRDTLCLRYGWHPPHVPAHCVCGVKCTVEHAMSCPKRSFPSIRHNEIRDITVDLLSEVCHGVGTEPYLQPVTQEQFKHKMANKEDGAHLDVIAESFWGKDRQCAFFDIRVFNPFAPSYRSNSPAQCYRRNELEKRRSYDERVREVEHGSFSPLVFSTTGGMGTAATAVYKRLASLISEKQDKPYSRTMHWLRCRLSFSLLRSAIMCLRGSRSARHHPSSPPSAAIDLACAEGRVYSSHQ